MQIAGRPERVLSVSN